MQKAQLAEIVDSLPDEVDLDALIERLHLLRRLEIAEEEIAEGKLLEHDEVKRRFASWLE